GCTPCLCPPLHLTTASSRRPPASATLLLPGAADAWALLCFALQPLVPKGVDFGASVVQIIRLCDLRGVQSLGSRLPLFCKRCTEGGLSRADGFPYDVSRTSVSSHSWVGPSALGQLASSGEGIRGGLNARWYATQAGWRHRS